MKKLLLTALAVTCAASVFAQGTVILGNRFSGTYITHVYLAPTTVHTATRGMGSSDFPVGTFDWAGYTLLTGNGYTAQLLAADGADKAESSLVAAPTTTTFRTGGAAGNIVQATATLTGVAADSAVATVEMVVWENKGGLYTTWAQAYTAWQAGLINAGTSGTFNLNAIGGAINGAPVMSPMQSFAIYTVPEPSTMALAGLGAAALLIFRRRK